jgi:hypothetical protein
MACANSGVFAAPYRFASLGSMHIQLFGLQFGVSLRKDEASLRNAVTYLRKVGANSCKNCPATRISGGLIEHRAAGIEYRAARNFVRLCGSSKRRASSVEKIKSMLIRLHS